MSENCLSPEAYFIRYWWWFLEINLCFFSHMVQENLHCFRIIESSQVMPSGHSSPSLGSLGQNPGPSLSTPPSRTLRWSGSQERCNISPNHLPHAHRREGSFCSLTHLPIPSHPTERPARTCNPHSPHLHNNEFKFKKKQICSIRVVHWYYHFISPSKVLKQLPPFHHLNIFYLRVLQNIHGNWVNKQLYFGAK